MERIVLVIGFILLVWNMRDESASGNFILLMQIMSKEVMLTFFLIPSRS